MYDNLKDIPGLDGLILKDKVADTPAGAAETAALAWGSCNADTGRIWLNLELARKATTCLEYILVHEMTHFLERRHGDRFLERMNRLMPQWRLHREELNRAPLAHEDWRY